MNKLVIRNAELARDVAALADLLALEFNDGRMLLVRPGQGDEPVIDANANLHVRALIRGLRQSSGELTRSMNRLSTAAQAAV